jgi:serine/threonine protein kinase
MTVQTTMEYWTCLEKSRLFDADQLDGLRAKFADIVDPPRLARKLIEEGLLTDWQARFLLTGRFQLRIGAYVLKSRISSQMVGDRFLAMHKSLDRDVEVNVFPASLSDHKGLLDQFLSQARKVAGVDHPNLVHLYDIDTEGGRFYFVYERDNGTRLDRLPAGSLNTRQIAEIVRQLLCGLECARQHGLFHGRLNESQVRVSDEGHARISNVGLATMLDEISHADDGPAGFAGSRRGLEEDLQAVGSIGQGLLDRHVGSTEPTDELEALFFEIKEIPEANEERIAECIGHIDMWSAGASAAADISHAAVAESVGEERPVRETASVSPYESEELPASPETPRPVPPTSRASRPRPAKPDFGNTAVANDPGKRRKTLAIIGGGLLAIALTGIAGWMWFGEKADDMPDLSQARGLDDVNTTSNAGKTKDGALDERSETAKSSRKSKDKFAAKNGSPLDKAVGQSKNSDEPGESTISNPQTGDSGDKVADGNTAMQQDEAQNTKNAQDAVAEDIVKSPVPGPGELVNGTPVIDWKNAKEFAGQKVVIRGTVASTGNDRSGSITFLNFDKSNRDAFTVVVKRKAYSLFPQEPKEYFKSKDVVVVGTIILYQDRVPQIEITEANQIAFAEGVESGMAAMPGGNTGGSPPGGNSSSARVSSPATTGHFDTLPASLPVPEFTKVPAGNESVVLGTLNVGDELLAMEVVVPAGFGIKNGQVQIERTAADRNRWKVSYSERNADAAVEVAEIVREGNELKFRWKVPESVGTSVNFIRNCLLRIQSPTESALVGMRAPLEIDDVVLTSKKASWRESIPAAYLPDEEFLFAELMPMSAEVFPDQISELGYEVSANQPATEAYFERDVTRRIFAIGFSVQFGSSIRVEAGLVHTSPTGFVPFRESTYRELGDLVAGVQQAVSNEKLAADRYEAPTGQKTRHKDYVKELSKKLDEVNAQLDAYNVSRDLLPKILAEPVRFRIIYRTDLGKEIELVRTKGFSKVAPPPPPAEEGKEK